MLHTQKIKIKKGVISVDATSCSPTDEAPLNVSSYNSEGEEIIFIKHIENYVKETFLNHKTTLTTKSDFFTRKMLVRSLISNKVNENCKLNPDKIERFILKYDEHIEKG